MSEFCEHLDVMVRALSTQARFVSSRNGIGVPVVLARSTVTTSQSNVRLIRAMSFESSSDRSPSLETCQRGVRNPAVGGVGEGDPNDLDSFVDFAPGKVQRRREFETSGGHADVVEN